ncbi:MAG: hypothetical protein OSJ70_04870 [Bacilli bacterium]|nr:hypothetical protein [Bacilli bacterium]
MKKYNAYWNAAEMQINFNQKQWRQDLAAFISKKLNWTHTRVTRSKIIEIKEDLKDTIKEFEVFSTSYGTITIQYTSKNKIISSTNEELINEYFAIKGFEEH